MKRIFITGCGQGLGRALFNKGLALPCAVYPHFRKNAADATAKRAMFGDLNDAAVRKQIPEFLNQHLIDVFINNAAIYENGALADLKDDKIKEILNTNLISPILILRDVYRHFKKTGSGLIININSLAGLYPSENESVYCASKFGLRGFSKCLQLEALSTQIEIVDVFLGGMKTRMTSNRSNYEQLMNPDEIADAIYNVIFNENKFSLNELVIRKKTRN